MTVKFPAEFEMKIVVVDGDRFAVATVGLGHGKLPTEQEVAERIARFEKDEMPQVAPNFRLATAPELWDYMCLEKTGQTFATPADYQEFEPL